MPISQPAALPVTRIRPSTGWVALNLAEIWPYRELLYFFVWRDIKVRYRQTALGAAWAVIQPFTTMVVFSVFFGRLAGVPSDGHPYPLFAYCALVPWTYFAGALTQASVSLVDHGRLISKVYFPRVLVPAAAVASGLVDLMIAFSVLLLMLAFYDVRPSPAMVALPFFVLLAAATAFGVSLWTAALNVRYRDIRHIMPFAVQIWFFVTPVAYPSSVVPDRWRHVYALNPLAGIIDGFRWAVLGSADAPGWSLAISVAMVCAVLIGGLFFFRRTERTFADVL